MDGGKKPPDPPGTQEEVVVAHATDGIEATAGSGGTSSGNVLRDNVSNHTNQQTIGRPKTLYEEDILCDSYKILVQAKRNSTIGYHKLGQELANITSNSNEILYKEKLSKDKVLIACGNAKRANTLVNDETLSQKYNVFIPQNYVSRSAIIRDIDTDVSKEDVFEALDTRQFKLLSVERLNRRTTDEKGQVLYVPSKTMKLNFAGQDIPANVYLWYSKIMCEPFIQKTLQCFKCMRFGHASNKCKANFEVCRKCYQVLKNDHICQLEVIKCLNCDGLHNPKSKNCPELQRQKDIKKLMSTRNLCFQEAAKVFPNPKQAKDTTSYAVKTNNSFSVLTDLNDNFPMLGAKTSKNDKLEKYVPPPLPYKQQQVRSSKNNNQYGKKTQKTDIRPETSGFNFNKKLRKDPKEKQENTIAPLFYKMCAERKQDEANQDKSKGLFNFTSSSSFSSDVVRSPDLGGARCSTFSNKNTNNNNYSKALGQRMDPKDRNFSDAVQFQKFRMFNSKTPKNHFDRNRFHKNNSYSGIDFSDEENDDLLMQS